MTIAAASRYLCGSQGKLLVEGPWQDLGKGKFAVPVVGRMSRCELPDFHLIADGAGWKAARPDGPRPETGDR